MNSKSDVNCGSYDPLKKCQRDVKCVSLSRIAQGCSNIMFVGPLGFCSELLEATMTNIIAIVQKREGLPAEVNQAWLFPAISEVQTNAALGVHCRRYAG